MICMIYEKYFENLKGINREKSLLIQLKTYELYLKDARKLKDSTIETKIKHLVDFIHKVNTIKRDKKFDYNKYLLDYIKNGKFNDDLENIGSQKYRKDIHRNVMEGINFICEKSKYDNLISPLSNKDKKEIEKFDNPKFSKMISERIQLDKIRNIEKEILKDIGIKLHIDEDGKGYVESYELSKILNKRHDDIKKAIEKIDDNYNLDLENNKCELIRNCNKLDYHLISKKKKAETSNGGFKEIDIYLISEDLTMDYILGQNRGNEKVRLARYKYQLAFKVMKEMIEQLLKERIELKNQISNFMNEIRKKNRDLMIENEKLKSKK